MNKLVHVIVAREVKSSKQYKSYFFINHYIAESMSNVLLDVIKYTAGGGN